MTFELTQEQAAIQAMAKDFAEKVVAPLAAETDKTGKFPADTFKQLAEQGLLTVNIPEEYGGAGLDDLCKVLSLIEISKACGSTGEIYAVQCLVDDILMKFGTEEQKQKYLGIAAEGKVGAFALTEPGAGSDAAGVKTKAVLDGNEYVINGSKCFTSNMGKNEGEFVIVIALTQPELGTKGFSAIIVDKGTPGFTIGKTEDKLGLRGAAVSEMIFENCRVPKENLLGKEGMGLKIALGGLDGGRIGIASMSVGVAKGAFEAAVEYAKQRVQFGKPIAAQPVIQSYIAEMATRIEAAEGILFKAVDLCMRGLPYTKEAAMAKYYASETACYVTDRALQIHGGYGYMKDYPVERMYRDARLLTIGEGTSEIQKVVISKAILK